MHRLRSLLPQLLLSMCIAATLPACTKPAASPEATPGKVAPAAGAPQANTEMPDQAAKRHFLASRAGGFSGRQAEMTPTLRALVARDNACSADNGVCEIDRDPWLEGGGQEGGIVGEPRFETVTATTLQARVRMDYTYAWGETSKEPQTTCVLLTRDTSDATWLLADLIPACNEKSSLLGMLQQAYPDGDKT